MKFKILQFSVLLTGCLGLFFVCFPDCLSSFNSRQCEQIHFRSTDINTINHFPTPTDSAAIVKDSLSHI